MAKPEYYHELSGHIEWLREHTAALEKARDQFESNSEVLRSTVGETATEVKLLDARIGSSQKQADESREGLDNLKEAVQQVDKDVALIRQQLTEQSKRIEEWDRRLWGLVVILVGALLSLAAGLIVTLARK